MLFPGTQQYRTRVNPAWTVMFALFWCLLLSGDASAQQTATPGATAARRVELSVAVSPDVAGLEESGPVLITLTNQNLSSDVQILPGDVFRLAFDIGNGRIESLGRVAIATSNTIKGSDFLVTQGSGTAEVLLTYTGAAARFGYKDSIAVMAVVKTPTV